MRERDNKGKFIFTVDDFEFSIDALGINTDRPSYIINYGEIFETKQEAEERLAEINFRIKLNKPIVLQKREDELC